MATQMAMAARRSKGQVLHATEQPLSCGKPPHHVGKSQHVQVQWHRGPTAAYMQRSSHAKLRQTPTCQS